VGKASHLYPTDPLEALEVDEILDAIEDYVSSKIAPTMNPTLTEEKRKEMRLEIANTSAPDFFSRMEKVLERNGTKENTWAVSKKMTIADLKIYYAMLTIKSGKLDHIPTTILDHYPLLNHVWNHVKAVVDKLH